MIIVRVDAGELVSVDGGVRSIAGYNVGLDWDESCVWTASSTWLGGVGQAGAFGWQETTNKPVIANTIRWIE